MDVMNFFDILIHPKDRMPVEKKNASVKEAVKTYAIVGIVFGLLLGIILAIIGLGASAFFGGMAAGLGLAAIIVAPIVLVILLVAGNAVSSGVVWIIAKILGGSGTFTENYYLFSRLIWPLFVAEIILSILSMVPFIGWLIPILFGLYMIYVSIVLVSVANNISMLRALMVWLIPIIILGLLFFALFVAILANLMKGAGSIGAAGLK